MRRAISLLVIVAIALQTVGCSTWRPAGSLNEESGDRNRTFMRDQALGKLKEGMRANIRIREGARVPIDGRVIKCVVKRVTLTSLTVILVPSDARNRARRELTLSYADIVSIEYHSARIKEWPAFVLGASFGTILGFLGAWYIWTRSDD